MEFDIKIPKNCIKYKNQSLAIFIIYIIGLDLMIIYYLKGYASIYTNPLLIFMLIMYLISGYKYFKELNSIKNTKKWLIKHCMLNM